MTQNQSIQELNNDCASSEIHIMSLSFFWPTNKQKSPPTAKNDSLPTLSGQIVFVHFVHFNDTVFGEILQ